MSLAGASAIAASVALLTSGVALTLFFSTQIELWGRLNDATSALFGVLMMPPAIELARRAAEGSRPVALAASAVGLAGMTIIAGTSGLTAAGKLDWLVSAKIGLVGFAGLLLWVTVVSVEATGGATFPRAFAWLGVATVCLAVLGAVAAIRFIRAHGTLAGEVPLPLTVSAPFALVFVGFVTWTSWLGLEL